MDEEAALTRLGLWGERRWSVGETGLGRYVQYAQSPAPVGPRIERALDETGRLWVLSDERSAPLQARIATLGGEVWLGSDWIFSGTGYIRRTDGILLPDATEGLLVQRSPLVKGAVTASGLDVSLRRLAGRLTGSVGYSLGHARAEALGVEFPAPTDRRHVVDLTTWVRISRGVSAGAAYTGTRATARLLQSGASGELVVLPRGVRVISTNDAGEIRLDVEVPSSVITVEARVGERTLGERLVRELPEEGWRLEVGGG